jgi:hypothetical protein
MIRCFVCSIAVALSAAAPATAGSSIAFAFGRTGGNIAPLTVEISASGAVTSTGPAQPKTAQLAAATRTRLATLVRTTHFFTLPRVTRCRDALPDFASLFVTVRTPSRSRTVLVHGDCSKPFTQLYHALANAVGVPD